MNALLLSAGLGTRLKPITDSKPKALVTVAGRTLLDINIEKLINHGFTTIVINVHHHASLIIDHLRRASYQAEIIISDETQQLMDTGGAIMHAKRHLQNGGPFLVHNVDIISYIDLSSLYSVHCSNMAMATLAVSNRQSSRKLLFNSQINLCGWRNTHTNERVIKCISEIYFEYAFSGIHVISPSIFERMAHNGCAPFSIIDEYLMQCIDNKIIGVEHPEGQVLDVGTPERLAQAENFLAGL
ncbi:MAG: nucleotidyltransferase family protein [Bacteroidales bacterium]|nr:nucleotidyltransferase family protein [Bacteroidales bacterium]